MQIIFNFVVISLAASVGCKAKGLSSDYQDSLAIRVKYTELLKNIMLANIALEEDLNVSNNRSAEFLKIYIAVIDLADQVDKYGENAYKDFYVETVKNAIKQVMYNPVAAEKKLWDLVYYTNKELQKISSFIQYKLLPECMMLTTRECDLLIAYALNQDTDLKRRSKLLVAGGIHGKIFLDISSRLEAASKNRHFNAIQFLVKNPDVLKPLVLAADGTVRALRSLIL